MMTYKTLREQAVRLRSEGYSYNLISEKLSVSKSTLSYWLTDTPYTPNQEVVERIGRARAKSGEVKSQLKKKSLDRARDMAKNDIGSFSQRDLFMLGLGLYMGEGTKTKEIVRVINADPSIIRLTIRWFQQVCGLKKENFSIRLHLYPDSDEKQSTEYWSNITGLAREHFQKTQIDTRENKKASKKGKLPYGTAHVSIRSCGREYLGVFLARRIKAWTEEVVTQAGIVQW